MTMTVTYNIESMNFVTEVLNTRYGDGVWDNSGVATPNFGYAIVFENAATGELNFILRDGNTSMQTTHVLANQTEGAIARLASNDFVVVGTHANGYAISLFSGVDGTQIGSTSFVADLDTIAPDVAALQGGGFVVASQDMYSGGTEGDIELRYFSNSGVLTTSLTVNISATLDDRDAQITTLSNGSVAVVWTRRNGADYDVCYAIYSSTGAVVKAEAVLAGAGLYNRQPVIATTSTGFVVAYERDNGAGNAGIGLMDITNAGVVTGSTTAMVAGRDMDSLSIAVMPNDFVVLTSSVGANDTLTQVFGTGVVRPVLDSEFGYQGRNDGVFTAHDGLFYRMATLSGGFVITEERAFTRYVNGDGAGDTWTGDGVRSIVNAGGGADTLNGGSASETLNGDDGNDIINGGAGDDVINGGAGDDVMQGGAGNDVFYVDSVGDTVSDTSGVDDVIATVSYALGATIENLVLAGTAHLDGYGNEFVNSILGNNGNNRLYGYGGDDALHGNDGNDALYGGAGNDSLYGGSGDDILSGGEGMNYLEGGVGNDTYYVNDGDDVHEAGGGGNDVVVTFGNFHLDLTDEVESLMVFDLLSLSAIALTGSNSNNLISGNAGFNYIRGMGGDDNISGLDGDDVLEGGDGADTLYGDNGNDYLDGGQGADVLNGGAGIDAAEYRYSGAGVNIDLQLNTASGGDAQGDSLISIENIVGTAFNDILNGNEVANELAGGDGNDILRGGGGDDILYGGLGVDTMVGGAGNDTFHVDEAGDIVSESAGGGNDTVFTSVSYAFADLSAEIEVLSVVDVSWLGNLSLSGTNTANRIIGNAGANYLRGLDGNDELIGNDGDDDLQGDAGNDILSGGSGNDILSGGAGADSLDGGSGFDTVDYSGSNAAVTINLTGGANTGGHAAGDTLIGIENAFGSIYNDVITGTLGANDLQGLGGDDILYGLAGADRLYGFIGNDILSGGEGDDWLEGGAGADGNYGGDGVDTVSYFSSVAGVSVNLLSGAASGGHAAGDTFFSIENLEGSNHDDSLTGNAGANRLVGGFGNDFLDGGAGADVLVGGVGNDTYVIGLNTDVIIEFGGEGTDTVLAYASYTLSDNVENMTMLGGALNGTGNGLANTIIGTALANIILGNDGNDTLYGEGGNDLLNGGVGDDVMYGGLGDDTFVVGSLGDIIYENVGEGIDTVQSYINGYTLTNGNLENLTLMGGAVTGYGNGAANVLTGTDGANFLYGRQGNDTINGGLGNDTLYGEEGDDVLNGGSGDDVMNGGLGNDVYVVGSLSDQTHEAAGQGFDTTQAYVNWALWANVEALVLLGAAQYGSGNALDNFITGNALDNYLYGNDGNDYLEGGAGNDRLWGGSGADRFAQLGASFGQDLIYDFQAGAAVGDRIEFSTTLFTSFADVLANATDVGGNCVIAKGGQSVTLIGVLKASLHSNDFQFISPAPLEEGGTKDLGPLTLPGDPFDPLEPLVLPSDFSPKGSDADIAVICPVDPVIADLALDALGGHFAKPVRQAAPAELDWTW